MYNEVYVKVIYEYTQCAWYADMPAMRRTHAQCFTCFSTLLLLVKHV